MTLRTETALRSDMEQSVINKKILKTRYCLFSCIHLCRYSCRYLCGYHLVLFITQFIAVI